MKKVRTYYLSPVVAIISICNGFQAFGQIRSSSMQNFEDAHSTSPLLGCQSTRGQDSGNSDLIPTHRRWLGCKWVTSRHSFHTVKNLSCCENLRSSVTIVKSLAIRWLWWQSMDSKYEWFCHISEELPARTAKSSVRWYSEQYEDGLFQNIPGSKV